MIKILEANFASYLLPNPSSLSKYSLINKSMEGGIEQLGYLGTTGASGRPSNIIIQSDESWRAKTYHRGIRIVVSQNNVTLTDHWKTLL